MDSRDRDAISDLFRKLRDVEHQAGPRDAEAERLIADETQRLPGASYYMAQTIVMQDMALNAKQQELDDLKRRVEHGEAAGRDRPSEGGGFLSRMFGGGDVDRAPAAGRGGPWGGGAQQAAPQGYAQQQPQYAQPPQYAPQQSGFGRGFGGGGGGGFLAGAAQTAMGVAGGVVLGNAIGSMFGGHGGLFGGGNEQPQEVVNETTNIYEGDRGGERQDASDQGGYADDNSGYQDGGYQDASYDDGGDFGGDVEDV
ncbi:DUF2076 domain-containing protein [Aureimonas leprariae]|uniref:DUF2076 domain-containing protein n=1 Tax=Plantimonas leprariae TaxID=2615207 RepID=A0A7V7PR00_9HYPH|nr:DUF2076 domain-containing protein [Aureimonas leprariae]KAB0680790.1 DUF2076 domain-containing protein [Aureimonas leprariae]